MEYVRREIVRPVAHITFSKPPVNAFDGESLEQICAAFESLADERVSVAVFRTGGDRAFIAGVDLKELEGQQGQSAEDAAARDALARRTLDAIGRCAVPVIAVVDGVALGGGLSFAAISDVVIASDRARFGVTEINVGVLGGASHLRRMVGPMRAREMYFSGRIVDAAEMASYGGIAAVVPHEQLDDYVKRYVDELAGKSPLALRMAKKALDDTENMGWRDAYPIEQDYTQRLLTLADSTEARRAFLEKRPPVWAWQ